MRCTGVGWLSRVAVPSGTPSSRPGCGPPVGRLALQSPSLRGRPFIEARAGRTTCHPRSRSPSLRGRPFIEAPSPGAGGTGIAVAVPSGTALHRGPRDGVRLRDRLPGRRPFGTALHRGQTSRSARICGTSGRRPFGDGPSSRPGRGGPAAGCDRVAVPSGTALHRGEARRGEAKKPDGQASASRVAVPFGLPVAVQGFVAPTASVLPRAHERTRQARVREDAP